MLMTVDVVVFDTVKASKMHIELLLGTFLCIGIINSLQL